MSYDFEAGTGTEPPTPPIPTANRQDLEAIVTLIQLAAICLTPAPDASFTVDQLLAETRRLGGDDIKLDERDVRIVINTARFLKKVDGRLRLK